MKSLQVLGVLAGICGVGVALAQTSGQETTRVKAHECEELRKADFSGVADAPTQVTEAKLIDASDHLPIHCRVRAYVSPNIGLELVLPTNNWNGKFLEVGCGAYCGLSFSSQAFLGCGRPLRKGYACIASDMGHQGAGAAWAYNNLQAEVDYGLRAAHVTAVAGKAITERFYSRAPSRSYFTGCSTGGRQALVQAQRFPWDFDGIVAGAPAINLSATLLNILWGSLATEDREAKPLFTRSDLQVLHAGALAKCDLDDGLSDGIISNPPACGFDPADMVCKVGGDTNCLSAEQVKAAKKIYSGPTDSSGKQLFTDGAMRGSEADFLSYQEFAATFSQDFFRFLAFLPDAGPKWQRREFDFDRDYKRLGTMESIYGGTDPDLRRFKASGGKLILYHGWADAGGGGIAPMKTVDYYETVEKTMGGRAATRDFLRFFMIPGMGHCGGGAGANDFDFLGHLEAWVERGEAPEVITGAHVDLRKFYAAHATDKDYSGVEKFVEDPANRAFTRPVYLYPAHAKYKGVGDPNDAASFVRAEP